MKKLILAVLALALIINGCASTPERGGAMIVDMSETGPLEVEPEIVGPRYSLRMARSIDSSRSLE